MAFNFREGEVLLIDKPLGWTSFDVVNSLRYFICKVTNIKKLKVGHAGTLDPMATGLLIICTGKMTKQIDRFQGMSKVYVGQMCLGATTPSYDKETEPDRQFDITPLNIDMLKEKSHLLLGEIDQVPPLYSAIKVNGERAYKLARKKEDVKLKSRKVTIYQFDIVNYNPPHAEFYVKCSKGTYIRSLIRDFGESLNNGAYLSALKRTQIGEYSLSDARSPESFKEEVLRETGLSANAEN
ncbi:MAG: tRNA pseudouridine synthase B [bacterium]|nr:MAG: tRNA pseudouridine synthase B [bacterium]